VRASLRQEVLAIDYCCPSKSNRQGRRHLGPGLKAHRGAGQQWHQLAERLYDMDRWQCLNCSNINRKCYTYGATPAFWMLRDMKQYDVIATPDAQWADGDEVSATISCHLRVRQGDTIVQE